MYIQQLDTHFQLFLVVPVEENHELRWYLKCPDIKYWLHPNVDHEVHEVCINDPDDAHDLVIRRIYQLICFPNFDDAMVYITVDSYYGQYPKAPISQDVYMARVFNDDLAENDEHFGDMHSMIPVRRNHMTEIQWRSHLLWWSIGSPSTGFDMDTWSLAERQMEYEEMFSRLDKALVPKRIVDGMDRHETISNTANYYWKLMGEPENKSMDIWLASEKLVDTVNAKHAMLEKRLGKHIPKTAVQPEWYFQSQYRPLGERIPSEGGDMKNTALQWYS